MSNEINYLPASSIGYKELSKQEIRIIRKASDSTEDKIVWILVTIAVWISYIILFSVKSILSRVLNILILVLLLAYLFFRVYGRLIGRISYISAANGHVVDKEVQYQKTDPKDTARLKPYNRNSNINVSHSTTERAFFYLTVKLENGGYVRYVNCTEKDYYNLDKSNKVLVVYYGGEKIQGYKI